jgi:hypothetical protein
VYGYEATARIVDFLSKASGGFVDIDFFDVMSESAGAAGEFPNVSASSVGQVFPMFEFSFVLRARRHSSRLAREPRLTNLKSSIARRGREHALRTQAAASTTSSTVSGRKITFIAISAAAKLQILVDPRRCQSLRFGGSRLAARRELLSLQPSGLHLQLRACAE